MASAMVDVWPELSKRLGIDVVSAATSMPTRATSSTTRAELFRPHSDGERTDALVRIVGHLLNRGIDVNTATSLCLNWNAQNTPPLPEAKVVSTCQSIGEKDAREHPERHRTNVIAMVPAQLEPLFDVASSKITKYLNTPAPARQWILNDFLPQGIVGMIVAPGGTGKSMFVMQMAFAIATGGKFANYWDTNKGGVLLLLAEEDDDEIHRRVEHLMALYPPNDPAASKAIDKNVHIKSMSAISNMMTHTTMKSGGGVVATDYAQRLILTARNIPNLKLIVIDPASRFRGGNENSADDTTRFIEQLELVKKETGTTILLVHHAHKGASKTEASDQGDSRGSSALSDGVRWQANLRQVTEKQIMKIAGHNMSQTARYLVSSVTKNNYGPPQEEVVLIRGDHGILNAVLSTATSQIDRIQQLVDLVEEEQEAARTYSAASFTAKYSGTTNVFLMGNNAMRELIKKAIRDGRLEKRMKDNQLVVRMPGKKSRP